MSYMNRLGNCKNRFQTNAKRVLCVCSAGLLRSPTMANTLHAKYGYNTRAAGYSAEYALIVADDVLVAWADEIVCASSSVASGMIAAFPELATDPRLVTLDLPDSYEWNEPVLVKSITDQYAQYLSTLQPATDHEKAS